MSAIVSAIQPAIRSIISSALSLSSVDLTPEQALMAIFAGGAKGAWYERSNISRLFTTATGAVAVAAAGNTIGLILDRSAGLDRGPELFNSDMSASGWSDLSVPAGSAVFSGGKLTLTGAGASNRGRVTRTVAPAVVAGKWYELNYVIESINASAQAAVVGIRDHFPITTPGSYRFLAKATTSNPEATFNVYGTGTAVFTKLSLSEVPGNHQVQATASLCPLYQTGPKRAVFDGTDDVLNTVFPAALGANCTVIRAVPGTGAVVATGVNIGASFADSVSAAALIIIDRPLSATETAAAIGYCNQQASL